MAEAGRLTDAEFAVLEGLWNLGRATIRDLVERLYPGGSTSEYATVQKLLDRLEEKGCAARDRSRHSHVFYASKTRDDLIGVQLQQMADRLCEGSLSPVVMSLVQSAKLSKKDRDSIRQLLDDADRRRGGAKR